MPSTLPDPIFLTLTATEATLVAACIAALASILTLIVNQIAARSLAKLTNRLTDAANVKKESRDYLLKQLTLFYDPLYTLLNANRRVFEGVGPNSKARRDERFDPEETAIVWKQLSEKVILPNNEKICEIIRNNLHYIESNDIEDRYLEFVTHANAYKVFKDQAYEAYSLFQYPKNILQNVSIARDRIRTSMNDLYNSKKG